MNPPASSPALQHLRILDLTRVRAGPTCCRIFADFGADVIQVETPEGLDPNPGMVGRRHGSDMQNLHRNKRSLTLNLKAAEGLAIFMRLVKTADVVVENYRPDVKERLGITYVKLAEINPRIILASISGFGQTGPYATRAGFDQIAQGMGGLMSVTGEPGGMPMRAGIAVADSSSGNYAAVGILIALAERERSGKGQWVQTSLLQAQIAMMDFQAAAYLVEGKVPRSAGNDHPVATPMGVVPTADGHINIGVAGERQWAGLCKAIGRPDLESHPDYVTQDLRLRHRAQLKVELAAVFKTRTAGEWLSALDDNNVPAGPIYSMDQVFADPQVQHLGMAAPLDHPDLGRIRVVASPIVLSRTPSNIKTPTVEAGADAEEILQELGLSRSEIDGLRSNGTV